MSSSPAASPVRCASARRCGAACGAWSTVPAARTPRASTSRRAPCSPSRIGISRIVGSRSSETCCATKRARSWSSTGRSQGRSTMADARRTLDEGWLEEASAALREANIAFADAHPGEGAVRLPVHSLYGGAQLFSYDTAVKVGRVAQQSMDLFAPDAAALGAALGILDHPALAMINERVRGKLAREAVEDYRIDFEDGYGNRPDTEEDGHCGIVVGELLKGIEQQTLPPFIGIRIKPLNEEMRSRSVRTLDLVMTEIGRA